MLLLADKTLFLITLKISLDLTYLINLCFKAKGTVFSLKICVLATTLKNFSFYLFISSIKG